EVGAHPRLEAADGVDDLAHGSVPVLEQLDDAQPGRVAEHAEEAGEDGGVGRGGGGSARHPASLISGCPYTTMHPASRMCWIRGREIEMVAEREGYDLVVLGSGAAGFAAAIR